MDVQSLLDWCVLVRSMRTWNHYVWNRKVYKPDSLNNISLLVILLWPLLNERKYFFCFIHSDRQWKWQSPASQSCSAIRFPRAYRLSISFCSLANERGWSSNVVSPILECCVLAVTRWFLCALLLLRRWKRQPFFHKAALQWQRPSRRKIHNAKPLYAWTAGLFIGSLRKFIRLEVYANYSMMNCYL